MKWECFFCGKETEVAEGAESIVGACGHCEVTFTAKEGAVADLLRELHGESKQKKVADSDN